MLTIDAIGWLHNDSPGGPRVVLVPSPRHADLAVSRPEAPVTHTTDANAPASRSAETWSHAPTQPSEQVSAHVAIDMPAADGTVMICQSVSFLKEAWHVAVPKTLNGAPVDRAKWTAQIAGVARPKVNPYTVGFELCNIGNVRQLGEGGEFGFYAWPCYHEGPDGVAHPSLGLNPHLRVDASRIAEWNGRFYDDFPPAQLQAYADLMRVCAATYGWAREHCGLGHVDFDPDRRQDPWPLFRGKYQQAALDEAFGLGAQTCPPASAPST